MFFYKLQRILVGLGAVVLMSIGLWQGSRWVSSSTETNPNVIYIYTWFDFLPLSILKQFTQETGIEVVVDYYDSNQTLEAQLLTRNSGYDIVFPSAWPYLERQVKNGLYCSLDKLQLPNWKHLDPYFLQKLDQADPGNIYAVPYFVGVNGIGYNEDMIKSLLPDAPIDSWALLFDPFFAKKFASCGIYFTDDAIEIFTTALKYLGLDPYSESEEDLEKALDLLRKVRPYIQRFDAARGVTELANGEACLIFNWSGDVALARKRAKEAHKNIKINFSIPKEGTSFWIDVVAIPVDAPHPQQAHVFLNFLMRPDVMAAITNEIGYANANKDALPLIHPELRNDPIVYPPQSLLDKSFISTVHSREHERRLTRKLLALKAEQ